MTAANEAASAAPDRRNSMHDADRRLRIRITLAVLALVAIGFYVGFFFLMGSR